MRTFFKLIILAALVYGGWWVWKNYDLPNWYAHIKNSIDNRDTRSVFVLPKKIGETFVEPNTIYIKDGCEFSPSTFKINNGQRIYWKNISRNEQYLVGVNFDVTIIPAGRFFVRTYNEPGTFDFNCSDDEKSKGQIIVK